VWAQEVAALREEVVQRETVAEELQAQVRFSIDCIR